MLSPIEDEANPESEEAAPRILAILGVRGASIFCMKGSWLKRTSKEVFFKTLNPALSHHFCCFSKCTERGEKGAESMRIVPLANFMPLPDAADALPRSCDGDILLPRSPDLTVRQNVAFAAFGGVAAAL